MDVQQAKDLSGIRLLILDVDGVLTDGSIIINADGTESKRFNVCDGHGIKMWQRAGFQTAIISGRKTAATEHRANQLDIKYVMQDCKKKLPAYEQLLDETGLSPEQTAYIGDDLLDLPLVTRSGFGVAVADAVEELREAADYVTNTAGGCGAVREVIEIVLKSSGKWEEVTQRYRV